MRDFNFFRSYQRQGVKKTNRQQILIASGLVAVILVVGVYGFNAYRIYSVQKDMDRMNDFMTKPENVAKHKKYTETKNKLALLNVYYDLANQLNLMIENDAVLDTALIERFEKAMPPNATLQSSKMTDDSLEIQGVTDKRQTVAEFENNLIETGDYEEVFVSNIDHAVSTLTGETASGYYVFSITCKLKEGIDR